MTLLDAAEALIAQGAGLCSDAKRAGCGSECCRTPLDGDGRIVAVTLPDLIALSGYIFRPSTRAELTTAVTRLLDERCSQSPVTRAYMIVASRGGCPFLEGSGKCGVYSARPMLCRLFLHCEHIGEALRLESNLDRTVTGRVMTMALDLGRYWRGQAGLLWRQPWRYDEVEL